MWTKRRIDINPVDVTIVRNGYICAAGSNPVHSFIPDEQNPFGKGVFTDVFGIFKVHRGHPLNVTNTSYGVNIQPVGDNRLLGAIQKDKMAHDFAKFLLVPYVFPQDYGYIGEVFPLKNALVMSDGTKRDASLVYHPFGDQLCHPNHNDFGTSFVSPSQVSKHFENWIYRTKHPVITHKNTFEQNQEGEIVFSRDVACSALNYFFPKLEERFGQKLDFSR